jgi:RND family efflux transporter MFP subunit
MNESSRLVYVIGAGAVVAAVAAAALLQHSRVTSASAEAAERERVVAAGPRVLVTRATRSPAQRRLELQGEARPYASVTLYAKVSGYLKEIRVDKGDRVQKDQTLAVIESPELDRQYDAALADAAYKRVNAKRAAALATPGVVSAREAELDQSQAQVAEAQVAALGTQKSYEVLRAPFAGMVTARFADPGALVQNATAGQSGALPVVTVSQAERLRVYIYVDQRDAGSVRLGDAAEVAVTDSLDGVKVTGKVSRVSGELDVRTRTMLVEVDLDNRAHTIVPGSFVTVGLTVKSAPYVEVPAEALVVRGGKTFVACIVDGRVSYRPVAVAAYDGARARLQGGLDEGAEIALNLGNSVSDGARVQPVIPDASKKN